MQLSKTLIRKKRKNATMVKDRIRVVYEKSGKEREKTIKKKEVESGKMETNVSIQPLVSVMIRYEDEACTELTMKNQLQRSTQT